MQRARLRASSERRRAKEYTNLSSPTETAEIGSVVDAVQPTKQTKLHPFTIDPPQPHSNSCSRPRASGLSLLLARDASTPPPAGSHA